MSIFLSHTQKKGPGGLTGRITSLLQSIIKFFSAGMAKKKQGS
jgi:hypothetical protein